MVDGISNDNACGQLHCLNREGNMDDLHKSVGDIIKWPDQYDYKDTRGSNRKKSVNIKTKLEIKGFLQHFSVNNNVNFSFLRSVKRISHTYYYYVCHHGSALLKGKKITDTQ